MKICEYGCGKEAKFKLSNGKWCCSSHFSKCECMRKKNSNGLKKSYNDGTRTWRGFSDAARKKSFKTNRAKAIKRALQKGSSTSNIAIKKYLLEDLHIPNKCAICSLSEWRGKPLTLELDHIDGNSSNNELENLRLLCPNCHSQTETFRGKSINTGKLKVTDEEILNALTTTNNIRQALLKVGLAPKGANYARAYKLKSAIQK